MRKQRSISQRSKCSPTTGSKSLLKTTSKGTDQKRPARVKETQAITVWMPSPGAQKVRDICQDVFEHIFGAKSDCNRFVKSVCDDLKANPFSDSDNADAITNCIRDSGWCVRNGWTQLNRDPQKAKDSAARGELIVAGATGKDLNQGHGHVVVVVDSKGLWKGYPYASWGKLGGVGRTNEKMTLAYKLVDLPKVSYMSKKV